MLMEKFFRVFGLAGVFIGWFVTESIYSMKKCGDISDVNKNT